MFYVWLIICFKHNSFIFEVFSLVCAHLCACGISIIVDLRKRILNTLNCIKLLLLLVSILYGILVLFWLLLNSTLVNITNITLLKLKYLVFTGSKILLSSLCSLFRVLLYVTFHGLPCFFGMAFNFVSVFCTSTYCFVVVYHSTSTACFATYCELFLHVCQSAIVEFSVTFLSFPLHHASAAYFCFGLVSFCLFLLHQSLLNLLCFLIVLSMTFVLPPSWPQLKLVHCLPHWFFSTINSLSIWAVMVFSFIPLMNLFFSLLSFSFNKLKQKKIQSKHYISLRHQTVPLKINRNVGTIKVFKTLLL